MEYEIKPEGKLSLGLSELWRFRELFYYFSWRDIKVKYKQTVLGIAWAVFQPLIMTLVFTIFFAGRLHDPDEAVPDPLFVLSAMLIWNVFSTGLSGASQSMVTNAGIIKKIYFPRLIIPMSSVLVTLFDFLAAFIVFTAMLIWYKQPV